MAKRHDEWAHTHVVGNDRAAAAPYLPDARKLLGMVTQDAAYNKLQTHQMTRRYEDGAVIVAEIRGGIPRMTIKPPEVKVDAIPLRKQDRLVVWARDEAHTRGIDAEHPQQVLDVEQRPAGQAGDLSYSGGGPTWTTRFYDGDVAGFDEFARAKDVYRRFDGRLAFPGGLRRAGNVDWASATGYRISWYGPSGRMFTDPYVQPRAQFGTFVFMLGEPLLDVEAYITASDEQAPFAERYVMGAALRSIDGTRWLYAIQADVPAVDTPMDEIPAQGMYFSEMYPLHSIALVVCRYRLAVEELPDEVARLRVVSNSREVLWSGARDRACQPWFFNAAGDVATSMAPPTNMMVGMQNGAVVMTPDEPDIRYTFDLAGDQATLQSAGVRLGAGAGSATLARDWDPDGAPVDLLVRRQPAGDTDGALMLELDGRQWALHMKHDLGEGRTRVERRWLLHVDLPERTLLLVVEDFQFTAAAITGGAVNVELWRHGERVAQVPAGAQYVVTGLPAYSDSLVEGNKDLYPALRDHALPPSWAIYGVAAVIDFVTRFGCWTGAAAAYAYLSAPAGNTFGSYGVAGSAPEVPLPIADWVDGGFSSDRADFDQHYSAIGCATVAGATAFCCPPYTAGSDNSLHWVDASTLPELTGVAGSHTRFHPIWRLGRFDLPGAPA